MQSAHATARPTLGSIPHYGFSAASNQASSLGATKRTAVIEFVAAALAAYAASVVYNRVILLRWPPADQYIFAALFVAALILVVSFASRQYMHIESQSRHQFLWNGIGAIALAFSFFQTTMFMLKMSDEYSRGTLLFQLIGVGVVVLVVRAATHSRLQSAIASGALEAPRAILIGNAADCARFAARLDGNVIKIVGSTSLPIGSKYPENSNSGDRDSRLTREMIETFRALRPDHIVILATSDNYLEIAALANTLSELPISLHVVPVWTSEFLSSAQRADLGNVPTIQILRPPLSAFNQVAKRAFDLAAAALGLIVLSPLFLTAALAIKLDSGGPVLFRQRRHGYNNVTIGVFKFRSMMILEDGRNFKQAVKGDARVTRVGRLLRSTNIDELPQLFNVMLGEMSIVGPRPHPIALNEAFQGRISPYSRRHTVKPGITGWAQVNGLRGATDTLEKMRRRFQHDIFYIDNWSFIFDIKIIVMTLFSKRSYMNAY